MLRMHNVSSPNGTCTRGLFLKSDWSEGFNCLALTIVNTYIMVFAQSFI